MTTQQLDRIAAISIAVCWGAVVLAWLAGAFYYQSREPEERTRAWYLPPELITAVIMLVLSGAVPMADWRPLEVHAPWIRLLGLAILLAATALALWARLTLGVMWTAAPAVKQQHQLRTGGPYAITRHPTYTGFLGMVLGSVLLGGAGRWILYVPIYFVLLQFKIHTEERLMRAEFPDDYPRYRQHVPQLIPGLRLHGDRKATSS
jgi:protein-S-isoprenylcysteine O-methyltransferase Ste14